MTLNLFCSKKNDSNSSPQYLDKKERLCKITEDIYSPNYKINRFEDIVNNYLKSEARSTEELEYKIIFYGSSTMYFWNQYLKSNFSDLPIIGHGFGGSTFPELIYYAPKLAYKLNPKIIVLYCENDFFQDSNKSSIQIKNDICELIARLKFNLPNTKIIYIGMKHSRTRSYKWPEINSLNKEIEEMSKASGDFVYIDLNNKLYKKDGSIDSSLFLEDKLHLNSKGYQKWADTLHPILKTYYEK